MRILFGLASPIVRNNGIMTFVRGIAHILKDMGHTVDFITDASPSIPIQGWFDTVFVDTSEVQYPSIIGQDGRPIIRYVPEIQNRISKLYARLDDYDVVIGNDAQSTAAFLDQSRTNTKVVHYIHTGSLLGENRTCLTDSFVAFERELLDYCIVGAQHQNVLDILGVNNGVVLNMPLFQYELFLSDPNDEQSGLMFIGDGTTAKGADIFERFCAKNNWKAKVIGLECNDVDFSSIDDFEMRSFTPAQVRDKAGYIRSAKAGFHPSPCDVMPFAIIEQLLSHPVVLDASYPWTKSFADLGALVVEKSEIEDALHTVMGGGYEYDNRLMVDYLKQVVPSWRKFLASTKVTE
jgi:hypothetical protein